MRTRTLLIGAALALALAANDTSAGSLQRLDGSTVSAEQLERSVAATMEKAGVAGLSVAIINDSRVVYVHGFGVKNKETGEPVDDETIFAAASFSKTVFAYLVMLLAEDGVIDLDESLYEYLDKPLPEYPRYADLKGDDRYKKITARIVLSHTTGFPNWRFLTPDEKLVIQWTPGERFGYSGEGIDLLQMVVEEVTGKGLEELARERVFDLLGMNRTSYVWQDWFEPDLAVPHDRYERPRRFNKRREADAAGSMATTAGDYAKLLVALSSAVGGRKVTVDEMRRRQIVIKSPRAFGPRANEDSGGPEGLSWSVGWGRIDGEYGRAYFHTGHEGGTQNYNVTFVDKGIGVVFLSNSDNFESVARELAEVTIGDVYSPFDWLGYPYFDPTQSREPPPEPVAIDLPATILKRYVGAYDLSVGVTLYVEMEEGRLVMSSDQVEWATLLAETETRFFVRGEDVAIQFLLGESDRVVGLILETEGVELRAERNE